MEPTIEEVRKALDLSNLDLPEEPQIDQIEVSQGIFAKRGDLVDCPIFGGRRKIDGSFRKIGFVHAVELK